MHGHAGRIGARLTAAGILVLGIVAGLAFLVAALYMVLSRAIDAPWAAAITGGCVLVFAGVTGFTILLWHRRSRRTAAAPGAQEQALYRVAVRWISGNPGMAVGAAVAIGVLAGMSPRSRRRILETLREVARAVESME